MKRELFDFMRTGVSLSLGMLAVSGYLLFNPLKPDILIIFLASFFLSCGVYGYNTITDKEEDHINKRVVSMAFSKQGYLAAFSFFALGILFSSRIGLIPVLVSITITITGTLYSLFRIKKYFLIKNIYTAAAVTQFFILGTMEISLGQTSYYVALFLFFFIGSIISDLRDYNGDKNSGVNTIPVLLGFEKTKKIIYLLIVFSLFLFLKISLLALAPLIVSMPLILILVSKNNSSLAHKCGGVTILFLTAWLFILKL